MPEFKIRPVGAAEFATAVEWAAGEGWNPGDFGFLGFYIVHPAHRGRGLGLEIWTRAWRISTAARSAWTVSWRNRTTIAKADSSSPDATSAIWGAPGPLKHENTNCAIRPVSADDLTALTAYDARHFPVMRESFIRSWLLTAAVALATRAGLEPVFETARLYRGPDPGLPLASIFGVTTFELG